MASIVSRPNCGKREKSEWQPIEDLYGCHTDGLITHHYYS